MKALLSTAGALALIATGAAANPSPQAGTVTLNAVVAPYIEIISQGSSNLTIAEVRSDSSASGNNNQSDSSKAEFEVAANVAYDVTLDWATFNSEDSANADPDYLQAYYANADASCAIGGAITFDVDNDGSNVAQQSSGDEELSSGRAEWKVVEGDPATWAQTYAVGTQASPSFTNCPGDIAAPGTYSLDVNITVSKAGT